jgi:hypothetical protein
MQGLILGKKKGLLVGDKYQAGMFGQDFEQGPEEPVADILDKKIGCCKADAACNKRMYEAASQVG